MDGKVGGGPYAGKRVVTYRTGTADYVLPNGKDMPKGTPHADRMKLGHTHGLK